MEHAVHGALVATDVDGNLLTYSISTLPTKGTVTVHQRATGRVHLYADLGATGAGPIPSGSGPTTAP